MRALSLSTEALIGLFVGLVVGLIEMSWELRALGVFFAAGLAVHIAKRLEAKWLVKIAIIIFGIGILVAGTWHPIWVGFHEDFPAVTGQTALARIIEFVAVAASGLAVYIFLIRPQGRNGYKVLPAQVIATGFCVMVFGLVVVAIGLAWQFQQNWVTGTKPSGAPIFTIEPPQIPPPTPPPALPAPPEQTLLFSNYNFTEAGVAALANELYKAKDALGRRIDLDRMSTDSSSGPLISNFARACDQAGIDCPYVSVHPNSPDEKGLLIYVADANKPPSAAVELHTILLRLGLDVPFVSRSGYGPAGFSLFIGPRPN